MALGVGLAAKLGKLGGLAADVTTSVVSRALKGEEITLEGVAIDVAAGQLGGKAAERLVRGSEAVKLAKRQADRLERIGSKPGARKAQRERAESAGPEIEKGIAQKAAQAGTVASGLGSAALEVGEGLRVDRVDGRIDSARLREELDQK